MNDFTVKINQKSVREIRSSKPVVAELERRGRKIVNAANKTLGENSLVSRIANRRGRVGYRMSSFQGKRKPQGRWFVQIYTASNHAKHSEAKHNTLIRVLNGTQGVNATASEEYTP